MVIRSLRFPTLVLAVALNACAGRPPKGRIAPGDFAVRDSGRWVGSLTSGDYAVLYRKGVLVDTVDLYFGVQRLNSGALMFLPLRGEGDSVLNSGPRGIRAMHPEYYVLLDHDSRSRLDALVPRFDNYFSSPAVINGVLYYWGLFDTTGIYAIRFDARRGVLRSCFLLPADSIPGTDVRSAFAKPTAEHGAVRFEVNAHVFLIDEHCRVSKVGARVSSGGAEGLTSGRSGTAPDANDSGAD